MSAVVRDLRPVGNEPDKDIVELLEGFLEAAKKGDLVAVAVIAHHRGRDIGTGYSISDDGDGTHLIAAAERLKLRLLGVKI